jgi:hypothetical protein
MIALGRLFLVWLVLSTIVYLLIAVYSRSVRREKLEKAWDTDPAREGVPADERAAFIEAGMAAYHQSLRRRLIWLVYVVPAIAMAIIIWFVNVQ